MDRQDRSAPNPPVIRYPVATELEGVAPDADGALRIVWRSAGGGALRELPLSLPFAWQLALTLMVVLTGARPVPVPRD